MTITVVVPVLNEENALPATLDNLFAQRHDAIEVIAVDGGSDDGTRGVLARYPRVQVIEAPRGRAAQMNAGAARARGETLLFLHADTRLPQDAERLVLDGLRKMQRCWGRFNVRIDSARPLLRLVSAMMNRRSRLTGVCTGDQAIFVVADTFARVGGYGSVALMEDIELSSRLRRYGAPLAIRAAVVTSARRWERDGVLRTIGLMWWLRLRYFFGASPARLARTYDGR